MPTTLAPLVSPAITGLRPSRNGSKPHSLSLWEPEDRLYTADELEQFPSNQHYELINGRLRELNQNMPAGRNHGKATIRLSARLSVYINDNDLGEDAAAETGFKLSANPDTVKAPDFAFTRADRVPPDQERGYAAFVPDLVVETRSPGDSKREIQEKIDEWLFYGCQMVLDIDPIQQTLTVHRPGQPPVTLQETDTFDGGDILPGLQVPLAKIFR